jgi:TolB-like protein
MAGEIFISYRRADEAWALLLHARLKAEGVDAWYDAQVGAGEDWRHATARALEASRIFVLLFTRAAAQSEDIAKELAAATYSKKLIVPVRIENIQPSGAFLYELASRNWVDAFENTEARLGELAKSLAALVRSGASDPTMLPFNRNAGDAKPVIVTQRPRRSWIVAAAAALVLLAAVGLGLALRSDKGKPALQSIAFFGFDVTGAAPGLEAIATSANNEVFDGLAATRLDIAARAETLGTPPKERFERAARQGAVYALSGEVLGDATQTTISIRLEDVGSRSTLWTDSVSGAANETVALPVRAAALATETLRCIATARSGLPKGNSEAVKLLARTCRERRWITLATIPLARDLQRVAPESPYAQAFFAISTLVVLPDAPESARPAMLAEAEAAARRAMELDPRSDQAWLARYFVAREKRPELNQLAGLLIDGLKVAPEAASLNGSYAELLQNVGRFHDALPYARVAVANSPLSTPTLAALANLLAFAGSKVEAEAAIERLMTRVPNPIIWQVQIRNAILFGVGDPDRLLAAPPAMISPEAVACWRDIRAAYRSRDARQRRRGAETVKACVASGAFIPTVVPVPVPVLASLGDLDGAFDLLAKADSRINDQTLSYLFWSSSAALRTDPRFLPLVEKLGLMAYWQKTGTQPDVCASEKTPFCTALKR